MIGTQKLYCYYLYFLILVNLSHVDSFCQPRPLTGLESSQLIRRVDLQRVVTVFSSRKTASSTKMNLVNNDETSNNDAMNDGNTEERMDLKGFAGYLGPYFVAFVVSIGVTAAFLKYVLLDY